MNLLAEAEAPMARRQAMFAAVFDVATVLAFYTMAESKGLSDLLDARSDERLPVWRKVKSLTSVWRRSSA
ncbi:MAG: hypothetical protein H7306_18075 [Bacteriovorax sp.]|nr:hypothetical protein [Rhizobacter sp.]